MPIETIKTVKVTARVDIIGANGKLVKKNTALDFPANLVDKAHRLNLISYANVDPSAQQSSKTDVPAAPDNAGGSQSKKR